jgi:hypothetical protein
MRAEGTPAPLHELAPSDDYRLGIRARLRRVLAGEESSNATIRLTGVPDLWHYLRINIREESYDQKTDHIHRRQGL